MNKLPWKRLDYSLAIAAVLALAATAAFTFKVQNKMADFEVYWTSGGRAAAAEPLYRISDGHYQFKYFPAFAFAFVPFNALPLAVAKSIWFGLSVGLLVTFIALSRRLLPRRSVPGWLIVIGTVLTLGKFYAHELVLGQTNLLLGVVAVAALAQLQRHRDTTAGATFAAAVIVKPYAVIFLPYLLVTKRLHAAIVCALVLACALALPALLYGFRGNLDLLRAWWETVSSSTTTTLTNQDNVSIAAMYAKWLGAGTLANRLAIGTSVTLLAVCAAVVMITRRRATVFPEYLEIALLLTVITLLSPQGWDYVLLVSTPAVMMLVSSLPRLPRPLQVVTMACLATVGLSLYDVMGRAAYARFMATSVLTLCYVILVGVLAYLRVRQIQ